MKFTQDLFRYYQTKGMPPAVQGVTLKDQTILITGANTGLGLEAAKHFARRDPGRLVMVCRSEERGRGAVECVAKETGLERDRIELWISDLTSFDSVRSVKEKIDGLERLDIIVENAGVAMGEYKLTEDGWETTYVCPITFLLFFVDPTSPHLTPPSMQVNLLSTALRILLHLPKLIETASKHPETVPRIVYVSSGSHYSQTISKEAIDKDETVRAVSEDRGEGVKDWTSKRYAESKVLGQSFMRALQPHLPTITCVSVGPGFCESDLTRHVTGQQAEAIAKMKEEYAYTSEEGGRQLLYAAIGERDRESEMRGGWVAFSEISECSDFLLGEEGKRLEGKVWREVLEVVGGVDERAREVIEEYLS
ncbi:hypothetical protein PQX77_012917 [Marasmius sp. AFHP31]|nr:hypothetical protein PQX77_012917 [Marasmius sp. AFHP31]